MNKFMYKPSDNKYGNIKVIARTEDVDAMLKMGWVKSPDEFWKFDDVIDDSNGDKGSGEPGTLEWDTAHVNQYKKKSEIVDHVKEVTGETIKDAGRMDYIKENAVEVLKAHYDNS